MPTVIMTIPAVSIDTYITIAEVLAANIIHSRKDKAKQKHQCQQFNLNFMGTMIPRQSEQPLG